MSPLIHLGRSSVVRTRATTSVAPSGSSRIITGMLRQSDPLFRANLHGGKHQIAPGRAIPISPRLHDISSTAQSAASVLKSHDPNRAVTLGPSTTNKPFKQWAGIFTKDSTIASAVQDGLLHHAETLDIEGASYRMKDQIKP